MAESCSVPAHAEVEDHAEAAGEGESGHESESRQDGGQELGENAHLAGRLYREKRIRNAGHSLGDLDLIAHLEAVTAEGLNDIPHVLKSYYTWMEAGPSKKSAKSYTLALKRLMVSHRKTLSAMTGDEYFAFVKMSVENLQCNSLIFAALKKLSSWFSERDNGLAGPWEHRAAHFEALFSITKGFTCWGGAPLPVMSRENAISCFFGRADKKESMCSTPPPAVRDPASETPLKRSHAASEEESKDGAGGAPLAAEGRPEKERRLAEGSAEAGAAQAEPGSGGPPGGALTADQLALIEANRAAALARRAAKLKDTIEAKREAALARRAAVQAAAAWREYQGQAA